MTAVIILINESQFIINNAAFLSNWGTTILLALFGVFTIVVIIVFIATVLRAFHGMFTPFFWAVATVVASFVAFAFITVLSISSLVPFMLIIIGVIITIGVIFTWTSWDDFSVIAAAFTFFNASSL